MFSDDLFLDERLGERGGGGWALSVSNICQYQLLYQRARQQILRGAHRHHFFFSLSKGFFDIILLRIFAKQGKIQREEAEKECRIFILSTGRRDDILSLLFSNICSAHRIVDVTPIKKKKKTEGRIFSPSFY